HAVEHPVVRDIPIPTHHALLGKEALARPIWLALLVPARRQGPQPLLGPALDGSLVGGSMHPSVERVTPGARVPVEILQIGEGHPRPKVALDQANTALDFPFGLWRRRLADPRTDA